MRGAIFPTLTQRSSLWAIKPQDRWDGGSLHTPGARAFLARPLRYGRVSARSAAIPLTLTKRASWIGSRRFLRGPRRFFPCRENPQRPWRSAMRFATVSVSRRRCRFEESVSRLSDVLGWTVWRPRCACGASTIKYAYRERLTSAHVRRTP